MTRVESLSVGVKLLGIYFAVISAGNLATTVQVYLLSRTPDPNGWTPVYNTLVVALVYLVAAIVLLAWSRRLAARDGLGAHPGLDRGPGAHEPPGNASAP